MAQYSQNILNLLAKTLILSTDPCLEALLKPKKPATILGRLCIGDVKQPSQEEALSEDGSKAGKEPVDYSNNFLKLFHHSNRLAAINEVMEEGHPLAMGEIDNATMAYDPITGTFVVAFGDAELFGNTQVIKSIADAETMIGALVAGEACDAATGDELKEKLPDMFALAKRSQAN